MALATDEGGEMAKVRRKMKKTSVQFFAISCCIEGSLKDIQICWYDWIGALMLDFLLMPHLFRIISAAFGLKSFGRQTFGRRITKRDLSINLLLC
jgi:hypothetical protein